MDVFKFAVLGALFASALNAQAQWLNAAYTYSDVTYKETGTTSQKGRFAGVRGELGLPALAGISISGYGEYQAGNMNHEGSVLGGGTLTGITKDYFRDLRGLLNLHYGALTISGGIGQRFWYSDYVTSYRMRQQYDYSPILLTYRSKGFYMRAEADLWRGGKNTTHMSDLGGARTDVEFKQTKGAGFGGEIGLMIPNAMGFSTHIFAAYHKWTVNASDVQFDGVDYLTVPENSTVSYQGGIGISF
jgi:hypothetical protein